MDSKSEGMAYSIIAAKGFFSTALNFQKLVSKFDIALCSYIYSMSELMKLLKKGVESFPQVVILWNDKKGKP